MSDLSARAPTAVFFVTAMVGGILWSSYTLILLFFVVNVFCLLEYMKLSSRLPGGNPNNQTTDRFFLILIGTIVYGLFAAVALKLIPAYWLSINLFLLGAIFIKGLFSHSEHPISRTAYHLLGLLWISVPCSLAVLMSVNGDDFNSHALMGSIVIVWLNDSFAYLTGRSIGKTPLFKRISPNKTWEGSIGGWVAAIVTAYLLSLLFTDLSLYQWLVLGVVSGIMGSLGDLIESQLKRSAKMKDSGNFFPGHGGFLDRFDAILFVIPFVFSIVYLWSFL